MATKLVEIAKEHKSDDYDVACTLRISSGREQTKKERQMSKQWEGRGKKNIKRMRI